MQHLSDIPKSCSIGKYVVLEEGVELGENVTVGHHSVILKGTKIRDNVTIGSECVLGITKSGNKNMRKFDSSKGNLIIKSNSTIGNHVSLYAGTTISENVFVADQASIREGVFVGNGTIIGRGAMVEVNTKIGKDCTIQTLGYITAETTLEDNVFIGPCVSMSNDKYMGVKNDTLKGPYFKEGAKVGNNASLLPGLTIGRNAVVGAGSVVTRDVPDKQTVIGVPAKVMAAKKEEEGSNDSFS